MNSHEVESQLSAMFDGELPAAECELLTRRLDRDESLRSRWSRYALIGAAMRSEPVATARSGFARRVSAALDAAEGRPPRRARGATSRIWTGALAASLVVAVAGGSISLLRYAGSGGDAGVARIGHDPAPAGGAMAVAARAPLAPTRRETGGLSAGAPGPAVAVLQRSNEPRSYVTPAGNAAANTRLRTQLADFIVAHSEYSLPLMRRNLLSALISNDPAIDSSADSGSPYANSAGSAAGAAAGQFDATTATSFVSR